MRMLALTAIVLSGCAPANYLYKFDLIDPGVVDRTVEEDADVRADIRIDPTGLRGITFEVTNKTDVPLQVVWDQISVVAPDREQRPLKPKDALGAVEPMSKVSTVLAPFELPAHGSKARKYDGSTWDLVVPMFVRALPHEYHFRLRATLQPTNG